MGESFIPTNNKRTKRGIMIKYWNKDYSVIRKNRFRHEKNICYFDPEKEILAQGFDDIRIITEGTNDIYMDNEEDVFYEIDTKLKFIHELKLDNNLKEKICFIDFPKDFDISKYNNLLYSDDIDKNIIIDEKNNVYKDLYYHLIVSSNIFLYTFYKYKINEKENQKALTNLYNHMVDSRGISMEELMNRFLFIINYYEKDFKSKDPSIEI